MRYKILHIAHLKYWFWVESVRRPAGEGWGIRFTRVANVKTLGVWWVMSIIRNWGSRLIVYDCTNGLINIICFLIVKTFIGIAIALMLRNFRISVSIFQSVSKIRRSRIKINVTSNRICMRILVMSFMCKLYGFNILRRMPEAKIKKKRWSIFFVSMSAAFCIWKRY